MSKTLIIIGIIFIIVGALWPFVKLLNLGHLPGDLVVKKESFSFYFPIMTCIIVSVILSAIMWFFNQK